MPSLEFSRGLNRSPVISTAEVLFNAPLPADFLNGFAQMSSDKDLTEIGLRTDNTIRVKEQLLPISNDIQVFVLNCLAIRVGNRVSAERLLALGETTDREVSQKKLTRQFNSFIDQFNEAAGQDLVTTRVAARVFRLQPVQFVQDGEPGNELFARLTETGRQKFGKRVIGTLQGDIERLEVPDPAAIAAINGDPDDPDSLFSWRVRGACRGKDMDLFFQEGEEAASAARSICKGCSVRGDCLTYALKNDIREGIWGGLSKNQRTRLKKKSMQH